MSGDGGIIYGKVLDALASSHSTDSDGVIRDRYIGTTNAATDHKNVPSKLLPLLVASRSKIGNGLNLANCGKVIPIGPRLLLKAFSRFETSG